MPGFDNELSAVTTQLSVRQMILIWLTLVILTTGAWFNNQPLTLRIVIAPRTQTSDVSGGMPGFDNELSAVTTRLSG